LHSVVDELCGRDPLAASASKLAALTASVTALEMNSISNIYQQLFSHAVGHKWTKERLVTELKTSSLNPKHHPGVIAVTNARRSEIEERLKNMSCRLAPAYLHDFDWALRLVMASDSISSLRNPLLVLNLTLKNVDGSTRNVAVELSKADVDALIANCDHINAVVQKLKL